MGDQVRTIIMACMMTLSVVSSSAQKELLTLPAEVEQRVTQALDAHVQSEDWAKFIKKHPLSGSFSFNLTIYNKGEVVSIQAMDRSDDASIDDQNTLKDYLKTFKFDFKVPKGKRYKVMYDFKIE